MLYTLVLYMYFVINKFRKWPQVIKGYIRSKDFDVELYIWSRNHFWWRAAKSAVAAFNGEGFLSCRTCLSTVPRFLLKFSPWASQGYWGHFLSKYIGNTHRTILNGRHENLKPPPPDICRNSNISMINFVTLPSERRTTTLYRRLQFCIKKTFKYIIMYEICIGTYRF